MKVAVFATDAQNRNQNLVNSICSAFALRLGADNLFRPGYRDLVSTCQENEIDLLVVFGGAGAIPGPLERALALVKTSVLWTPEDPYEIERNVTLAPLFDFVFTNDASTIVRYPNALGCLPFAADPAVHDFPVRERDEDFLFDLFFVGSAWPNRVASVNDLLKNLPRGLRYKIGIFGNQFLPDYTINDPNLLTDFRVAPREFARIANASLVNLTLDRSFSGATSVPVQGDTPPPRLFELALAGTAQVYLSTRAGVSRYFEPGREVLVVPDIKSAAGAVMDIIKDGNLRRNLAHAARRRALADHLYIHRVDALLSNVKDGLAKRVARAVPAISTAGKRRVLIVTHNKLGSRRGYGGVELYQQTMIDALKPRNYEFLLLYRDVDGTYVLADDQDTRVARYRLSIAPESTVSCPPREDLFARILQRENIDLVHFHHLIGHPLSLPLISRALGVPSVLQAHDFYTVCNEFNLLGIGNTYCDIPDNRTEICDVCLSSRGVAPPGAQARRRHVLGEVLRHVDRVFHLSHYARQKFISVYPEIEADKHIYLGYTGKPETFDLISRLRESRSPRADTRLQVAILGNFTRPKGGDLLLMMLPLLQNDAVDFHILGRVDTDLAGGLKGPNYANVIVHGEFAQEQLGEKLRDMDVSIHFSKWPETYCIAVDEARAAGIFPIVLGYGALAERVTDWKDGIIVDPERPFDLIHVLRRLVADRGVLDKFDFELSQLHDNYSRHVEAVNGVYDELIAARRCSPVSAAFETGRPLFSSDFDRRFNSSQWQRFSIEADENLGDDLQIDSSPQAPRSMLLRAWRFVKRITNDALKLARKDPPLAAATVVAVYGALTICGFFFFQYVMGLPPCPLCLEQRYAYYFSVPLAAMLWLGAGHRASNKVVFLGFAAIALAMLWNSGLGVYHAGVEWKFWAGPQDCSGPINSLGSAGNMLNRLQRVTVVRCDEAAWRLFGISLPGWNVLVSLEIAAVAAWGAMAALARSRADV